MPAACRTLKGAVAIGQGGTLRPGLTKLCECAFETPQACGLRHGALDHKGRQFELSARS